MFPLATQGLLFVILYSRRASDCIQFRFEMLRTGAFNDGAYCKTRNESPNVVIIFK